MNRRLADAAHDVWDGDLLLFRRRGAIAVAGRGDYTHAAMAGWWGGELMCLEIREFFGGRAVTLASQLKARKQGVDVFRPKIADAERCLAVMAMVRKTGTRYAWHKVAWAALLHLPFVRLYVRPDTSCDRAAESTRPQFCSEAVANAYHVASSRDPVPSLRDRLTEPNDLARTDFFERQFTLVS